MRTWFIHWGTAAFVFFMLLTSLPYLHFSALWSTRQGWLWAHMIIGWLVVGITLARLLRLPFLRRHSPPHLLAPGGARAAIKLIILCALLAALATGIVIYRPSPLGPKIHILSLEAVGVLLHVGHGSHLSLISWHLYLANLLAVVLLIHIILAICPSGPLRSRPIVWLWQSKSR